MTREELVDVLMAVTIQKCGGIPAATDASAVIGALAYCMGLCLSLWLDETVSGNDLDPVLVRICQDVRLIYDKVRMVNHLVHSE